MTGFDALLHLQEHDTTIDQLVHRQAHLPEADRVAANEAARGALEADERTTTAARDEIAKDQKRIEDEVASVETKATGVNTKLYSGSVTSPKELQALQADFDSLKRRQAELEDHVIELMEAAEPVDDALAALTVRRTVIETETTDAAAALAGAQSEVARLLDVAHTEREAIVPDVPVDLLAAYERLRPQYAGIAVARLVGSNCSGCHLTLSAVALDNIRTLPADALATCDECGRILIR